MEDTISREKVNKAINDVYSVFRDGNLSPDEALTVIGNTLGLILGNVEKFFPEQASKRKGTLQKICSVADRIADQTKEFAAMGGASANGGEA